MAGFFITIEGIEGAGKSSIARRLESQLAELGLPVLRTREPGGTRTGEKLREIILNADHPLSLESELLLLEAARAQVMAEVILPHLEEDGIVILDRHCDSTIAYQGYGRGLDRVLIGIINQFVCHGRIPDLTLLLDVDVREGLARARRVKEKENFHDRFESEAVEFMQRVRNGFLEIAQQKPQRVWVFSAQEEEAVVWEQIWTTLGDRILTENQWRLPGLKIL